MLFIPIILIIFSLFFYLYAFFSSECSSYRKKEIFIYNSFFLVFVTFLLVVFIKENKKEDSAINEIRAKLKIENIVTIDIYNCKKDECKAETIINHIEHKVITDINIIKKYFKIISNSKIYDIRNGKAIKDVLISFSFKNSKNLSYLLNFYNDMITFYPISIKKDDLFSFEYKYDAIKFKSLDKESGDK